MTKEFEVMLRLFGDNALGRKSRTDDIKQENIPAIINAAHKQGVWTCVYPQLTDDFNLNKYKMTFLSLVSRSVRQNEFTMNILEEARLAGLDYCLLKGVFAASLYASPDYRISGDVDILIKPKDENKFSDFLRSKGYNVEARKKNEHHTETIHPVGGILEVHVRLYGHVTEEVIFGKKVSCTESYMSVEQNGRNVYTLGVNDNLKFLTAHYIKHFVAGESGVRQMMDLLLFMKKYKNEADFEAYDKWLEELRYKKLIDAVKSVGAKYFGMDFAIADENYMNLILDDCEKCGLFAQATDDDVYFYRRYCEKRNAVSKTRLKFLFWFKHEQTIFDRIFLPQKKLVNLGYAYAGNKLFVPFAWGHRLFDHAFGKKTEIKQPKNSGDYIGKRESMMKKLDLFD